MTLKFKGIVVYSHLLQLQLTLLSTITYLQNI